jgi:hypothetical protein
VKKLKKDTVYLEPSSTEREIAENQLERLRMISRERLMTFEEVRIYDILTKNLLLAKGEATTISAQSQRLEEAKTLSEDVLLKIAQSVDETLVNRSLDFVDDSGPEKDPK